MTDHETDPRDDAMDARLTATGARWRAAHSGVPEVPELVRAESAAPPPATPRRRGRIALLASAAAVAAALVVGGTLALRGAGDHGTAGGEAGLYGTVWALTQDGRPSTSTFRIAPDGELVASDECDLIGGTADVDGGTITVAHPESRPIGCTDTYEPAFRTIFEHPVRYDVDGDRLTLTGADQTLYAVAAPQFPAPTLDVPTFVGAHWQLVAAKDAAGAAQPVVETSSFYVDADLKLTASDSCSAITRTVEQTGRQVRLGNGRITHGGCSGASDLVEAMLQDGRFEQTVTGATLKLTSSRGTLTYRWIPDEPAIADPSNLVGPTWRLIGVAGDPPAGTATVHFPTPMTFEANDGCSSFAGTAELDTGTMSLTGVPREPSCGAKTGNQASTFDSFLSQSGTLWSIREGKLIVEGGGAQAFALVFEADSTTSPTPAPQQTAGDARLVGPTWTLTGYENGSGNRPKDFLGSPVSLTFDDRGRYALSLSCSQTKGQATVDSARIDFASDTIVDLSCSKQEAQDQGEIEGLLRALHGSVPYTVSGDTLTLTKDGTTLTFAKR